MSLNSQEQIRLLLQLRLKKAQENNPNYSLRSFAQKLGIHSSALSEILNAKRKVSIKLFDRIAEGLGLSDCEREKIKALFPGKRSYNNRDPLIRKKHILKMDQYKLISKWYYPALLSLIELDDHNNDICFMANRLGLAESTISQALNSLERLTLISKTEKGLWKVSYENYNSPDNVAIATLRNAHLDNLQMAKTALMKKSIHERDFLALTLAFDPAKLSQAKKLIREFMDEFCLKMETGKKKEVFKLALQFFPLTQQLESTK